MSYSAAAEESLIKEFGVKRVRKAVRALQIWPNPDDSLPQILKKVAQHLRIQKSALSNIIQRIADQCPGLTGKNVSPKQDPRIFLPPTRNCFLGCERKICSKNGNADEAATIYYKHDTTYKCTIFDIDGTHRPCWRFNLNCKKCGASYGYKTYHNPQTGRRYSYMKSADEVDSENGYIFMSREAVFTSRLCWLITQDIFVKQCSFQSFSTAISNTYGITEDYNRKQVIDAFFKYHIEQEIYASGLVDVGFEHEYDWDDILATLNKKNAAGIYPHECSALCAKRGCKWVNCVDGNWKLTCRLCSFKVKVDHPLFPFLRFPNNCTQQPAPGSLFCANHLKVAQLENLPCTLAEKRAAAGTASVRESVHTETMDDVSECSKNKGAKTYEYPRSRGYLFIVTAGGIIRYFRPLYGSESNSQVFYTTVQYLSFLLRDVQKYPVSDWNKVVLCYDDMCHLDGLTQAKHSLPFPAPYDTMWSAVTKVIDRFHLKNHVREKCHVDYNPEKICLLHGDENPYNTEAAEQVFSWLKQFKGTVFSMAKDRQEFLLHIMVKLHNEMMENAMKKGRFPIHPNGRRRRFTL